MSRDSGRDGLRERVTEIGREAGAERVAVAFHDYRTRASWACDGDRWFHAASTIKVPILVGVFGEIHRGELARDSRVHVRNRFLSVAGGAPFRVDAGRDANTVVPRHLGRTMKLDALCYHMIVTSSNLATNLLVDLVGIDRLREHLAALELGGIELRRGVEDDAAFEAGINNRVTANGLARLLRHIEEGTAFDVECSARMLEILHQQEFRSGIPAGVPDEARVANKTGEISTIAHDAGIVYLPDRAPYVLAVLTEWAPQTGGRSDTIARISRAVYQHLCDD
jgi:beta-lactamase class A